ncbi:MAG: TonB-dependent receptor [Sphingobacteriales bacterium]|nr:MAG: TonB-dependent receptor [Sphingobacteriales bacterium]
MKNTGYRFSHILYIFFAIFLFSFANAGAQTKYTISGYVKDDKTGEELIGAVIMVKEIPNTGATTNAYGFYSITIPAGKYNLIARYIGYAAKTQEIDLQQNTKVNFSMQQENAELKEVVISGTRQDENVTKTQIGVEKINVKEIQNIPVFMGEKDVLKTIQLMPGIKTAGEGNSGFYVRGGGADQNLILLDEATVYNASHLLGFFSVFNSDALKDVTIHKGTQPAEFGGRLSSVLDIKMNDGNDRKYGASGGIGLISSRLNIEGPIVKEKGSFMVSGRRTYADLFLKLSNDSNIRQARLYFYDLNAKANYEINEKNRIYLSGYFGKDVLGFGDAFGFDWGNATGTFRWNHLFSERMFSNTSLIYSDYSYNINLKFGDIEGKIISRIKDYNLKQDFTYYANTKNSLKFGFNSIYHQIIPGAITIVQKGETSGQKLPNKNAWENAVYASHEIKASELLSMEYGLRLNAFSLLGAGDFNTYDAEGNINSTKTYKAGEFVKTYFNVEPRFAINYLLDPKSSVKASLSRNTQNLHLISNSTSGNPTDLWIPSSNNIKSEISDQVSAGYFRNFKNNEYEFSTEVYYKNLQNQIDYKDGAQLTFNENVESQLLIGDGRAYGVEFFLKKKRGKFNGWIGYTLSRVEKKIPGINNDKYYAAKQDRTHDISVVGIYELTPKWILSAAFVYYTGNAVTFPSGKYLVNGTIVNYYTERNGYRMPAYHRLDLGATWQRKKTEKFESSWNFSLYNAYGNKNAYTITFRENPDDPTRTQAIKTTLFTFVPSVTYNFKF